MSITLGSPPVPRPSLTALAFAALTVLCVAPLLLESTTADILPPYPQAWETAATCGAVVAVLLAVVGVRTALDRTTERQAVLLNLLFVGLAIALTCIHWSMIDRVPFFEGWQRDLYVRLFRHTYDAPHQYRPLPYGFVRSLERVTHEWFFSCAAYRAFFTYWFLWGWYRLARTVHPPKRALLTLLPILPLYPLSILRYCGQLTDPVSHALLVFTILCTMEERPFALAAALALGVVAKETAVIIVPAYLAVAWWRGERLRGLVVTALLGVVAVLAFLAARLPLGWQPGQNSLNGAGLMIGTNLGIGEPVATSPVDLWENYLHPILFVVPFLPFIVWNWRRSDVRLRILFATLTPLLLLSNVCFGWLYESRNYVPLLPLLMTLALPVRSALPDRP